MAKVTRETKYYINKKEIDIGKYDAKKYADSIMFISNTPLLIITLDLGGDTISKAFININHYILDNFWSFIKMEK